MITIFLREYLLSAPATAGASFIDKRPTMLIAKLDPRVKALIVDRKRGIGIATVPERMNRRRKFPRSQSRGQSNVIVHLRVANSLARWLDTRVYTLQCSEFLVALIREKPPTMGLFHP